VAAAFPQAQVELWATRLTDEHRSGLKPLLQRVWTLPGQRPRAPVAPRSHWRYLVAFVHPASGRTVWHLASGVSAEHFTVELDAFAQAVGASPRKQIILVLDRAGWHRGMPATMWRSPTMCTGCSCQPIHLSFSPASISGRSAMRRWSTGISAT
jgi:DDE superfamily endonuclease